MSANSVDIDRMLFIPAKLHVYAFPSDGLRKTPAYERRGPGLGRIAVPSRLADSRPVIRDPFGIGRLRLVARDMPYLVNTPSRISEGRPLFESDFNQPRLYAHRLAPVG